MLGFGEALHLLEQQLIDQLLVVEVESFAVRRGHDRGALALEDRVNLCKNLIKKIIGRPVILGVPYTSKYRQLLVRARLRE